MAREERGGGDDEDAADEETLAAFALLGDETRVGILRALADAAGEGDPALAFGELRSRVGARDSGNFNYHLSKLEGRFVRAVDPDTSDGVDGDGTADADREAPRYRLTVAGQRVVSAIVAGAYADADALGPDPVEEECPRCGAAMTARYEDRLAVVECANGHSFQNTVPPSVAADRDLASLLAFVARRTRHDVETAVSNTCPSCHGPLEWDLDPDGPTDEGMVGTRCERCGAWVRVPPGLCHLHRTPVAAFFHDHGVVVHDAGPWHPAVWQTSVDVEGRDPARFALVTTLGDEDGDGETLRVVTDGELTPVEVARK